VIFDRLQRGRGIRFSNTLEPVYHEQLASERRVIRYARGMPIRRFERTGHAARQAVSIIYDRREAELRQSPPPKQSLASQLAR